MSFEPVNYRKLDNSQLQLQVDYCFNTLNTYFSCLKYFNLKVEGLNILEIGPGIDFGAQLILASMGANVFLSDKFLTPFDPDYHIPLYQAIADKWQGPKSELVTAIYGGHSATKLNLLPWPAEYLASLESGTIDFVYSNAVLEHVSDFSAVASELSRITKENGFGAHQIDWRDHRDFSRPLEHLTMGEAEFLKAAEAVSFEFGNRLRSIEFSAVFENSGFELIEREVNWVIEDDYFQNVLPRIRSSLNRYQNWPERDLRRISGRLYLKKSSGSVNTIDRSMDIIDLINVLKKTI